MGTRVIQASKQGTVDSLNALAPTLTELAKSGDDLANSLQIILTFPFIDGVVGKNPAQARDLHMGDYTNLSIVLDLDLRNGIPAVGLPAGDGTGLPAIPLPGLDEVLPDLPLPTLGVPDVGGLLGAGSGSGSKNKGNTGGSNDDGDGGGLLGGLGLGRAAAGAGTTTTPGPRSADRRPRRRPTWTPTSPRCWSGGR